MPIAPSVSLLVFMLAASLFSQDSLSSLKKIKIGSMGQSDEAERFRMLLDDELSKAGFITTEDANSADGVITGALSIRVYAEESRARVTVVLKATDGRRIWGKDFQPHFKLGGTRDTVRLRAQDVAKALQKDVQKSAKAPSKP